MFYTPGQHTVQKQHSTILNTISNTYTTMLQICVGRTTHDWFLIWLLTTGHVVGKNWTKAMHHSGVEDIEWEVSGQTSEMAPPSCASSASCWPAGSLGGWSASPQNLWGRHSSKSRIRFGQTTTNNRSRGLQICLGRQPVQISSTYFTLFEQVRILISSCSLLWVKCCAIFILIIRWLCFSP